MHAWRSGVLAALASLALAGPVLAQQAYTIRIKEPGPNEGRAVGFSQSTVSSTRLTAENGAVLLDQSRSLVYQASFRERVLQRRAGERKPTKLRRAYDKAVAIQDGKEEPLPYQGKTLTIEKNKSYTFKPDGGEALTGPAALWLEREFNRGEVFDPQQLLLPKQPVRLNETWQLDLAGLARDLETATGMQIDGKTSTGTGQLTRVYQKEGRTFGVLTLKMELPIRSVGQGKEAIRMNPGSRVVMEATLDVCIDGTSVAGTNRSTFTASFNSTVPTGDGKKAQLTGSIRGIIQETRTDLKN
jgi:hypothetical protein